MQIIRKIILTIILFIGTMACEEDPFLGEVNCDECYTEKPTVGELIIKLTINAENQEIPVVVYRNDLEDRIVEWIDTVSVTTLYVEVPVNQYYSITAMYKAGDRTIYAVDGDRLRTRKITDQCDETCWIITGGKINARLKYD